MNIELKNCKVYLAISQESLCFDASLYIDGEKVGTVRNDGNGGMNFISGYGRGETLKQNLLKIKEAEEYAHSLPPQKFKDMEIPMSLDLLLTNLAQDISETKDFRNKCKTKTLFLLNDEEGTGFYNMIPVPYSPEIKEHLEKIYGDNLKEIINERFK